MTEENQLFREAAIVKFEPYEGKNSKQNITAVAALTGLDKLACCNLLGLGGGGNLIFSSELISESVVELESEAWTLFFDIVRNKRPAFEELREFFNLSPTAVNKVVYTIENHPEVRANRFINPIFFSFASVIPDALVIDGLQGRTFEEISHPQQLDERFQKFAEIYWQGVWHLAQQGQSWTRLLMGLSETVVAAVAQASSLQLAKFIRNTPQCFTFRPTDAWLVRMAKEEPKWTPDLHYQQMALTVQSLMRDGDSVPYSHAYSELWRCAWNEQSVSDEEGGTNTSKSAKNERDRYMKQQENSKPLLFRKLFPKLPVKLQRLGEKEFMRLQVMRLILLGCERMQIMALTGAGYDMVKQLTLHLQHLGYPTVDGRNVRCPTTKSQDIAFRRQIYLASMIYLAACGDRSSDNRLDINIPAVEVTTRLLQDKENGLQKYIRSPKPLSGAEVMLIAIGWRMGRYQQDKAVMCGKCGARLFLSEGEPTLAEEGEGERDERCPVCHPQFRRASTLTGRLESGEQANAAKGRKTHRKKDLFDQIADDICTAYKKPDVPTAAFKQYVALLDEEQKQVDEWNARADEEGTDALELDDYASDVLKRNFVIPN